MVLATPLRTWRTAHYEWIKSPYYLQYQFKEPSKKRKKLPRSRSSHWTKDSTPNTSRLFQDEHCNGSFSLSGITYLQRKFKDWPSANGGVGGGSGCLGTNFYRQPWNLSGAPLLFLTAFTLPSSEESRVPITYWGTERFCEIHIQGIQYNTLMGNVQFWGKGLQLRK